MKESYDKCIGCGRQMTLCEVDENYNEFKAAVCSRCVVSITAEQIRQDEEECYHQDMF